MRRSFAADCEVFLISLRDQEKTVLLRFFRINDPYRLLGLFILLVLMSLPSFIDMAPATLQELKGVVLGEAVQEGKRMYVQVIDSTAPATAGAFER